jgi:D-alanyl-D-alanine carboxypeptidase
MSVAAHEDCPMKCDRKSVLLLLFAFTTALVLLSCSEEILQYAPGQAGSGSFDHLPGDSLSPKVQAILDRAINRDAIPAIQCALITADGRSRLWASGSLRFDRQTPANTQHLLRLGSISKLYTAVLTMQAVAEQRLQLDTALASFFPALANAERITIRQMLQHRSGIREILESGSARMGTLMWGKEWQTDELLEIISDFAPYFAPGQDFRYSNSNYILLGAILERVYATDLGSLFREKIFQPLQLENSYFLPDDSVSQHLIAGFDRDLLPWIGRYEHQPDNPSWASLAYSSGAMAATAADVAAFTHGLFHNALVDSTCLEAMLDCQPVRAKDHPFWQGYGLGVVCYSIGGVRYYGHSGLFIGFEAIALYQPDKGYVLVLLGNVSKFPKVKIIREIQRLL